MKQHSRILRLVCGLLVILLLGALPATVLAADEASATYHDFRRAPFIYSVDEVSDGKGFSGSSTIHVYENYTLPEGESITLGGWLATDEGISHYEYAWIAPGHQTPEWKRVKSLTVVARGDLAAAGIPYPGGHATAGFSFKIPPEKKMEDGYYDLYVRAITGDGVSCDFILFSDLIYGAPDKDDGETLNISFDRIAKTAGALQNAKVTDAGLVMNNTSMVCLGSMDLGAFERVTITYSIDKQSKSNRTALIGFKSSPDHPYGNGTDPYDLTDHLTALPLNVRTTDVQTAELDLSKAQLSAHDSLYLSAYLKDGINLTIHDITLTYCGEGYHRTAAKFYFSSDIISKFNGVNRVTLSGINDPTVGDALRFEVNEATNDPYAHFNAISLLEEYGLRLTADDYKYMVVLIRSGSSNNHSSTTFYLCAGKIYSATEACTHTFNKNNDNQWHYILLDLTQKENWTGQINGWRCDVLNGDSDPGDFVDIASIQLFRTQEAASKAASVPIKDVTPYTVGSPAVVRDDTVEGLIEDDPVVFEDGDWFVETEPETEPVTEPEDIETETLSSSGSVVTLPSADHDTDPPESTVEPETNEDTDLPTNAETKSSEEETQAPTTDLPVTDQEPTSENVTENTAATEAQTQASDGGCASTLGTCALLLLMGGVLLVLRAPARRKNDQ